MLSNLQLLHNSNDDTLQGLGPVTVAEEGFGTIVEPDMDRVDVELESVGGELTLVEDLDDSEIEHEVGTEDLHTEPSGLTHIEGSIGDLAKVHKEYMQVGIDLGKPVTVPAVAINVVAPDSYVIALAGVCYPTVEPMIHLLMTAVSGVAVELHMASPVLAPSHACALANAIELSDAKVTVVLSSTSTVSELLLLAAADEVEIGPGSILISTTQHFSVASSEGMKFVAEAHDAYMDIVFDKLIEAKILTEEEVKLHRDEELYFSVTNVQLKERLGIK